MIYQIVFSARGGFGFAIAIAAILHNVWRVLGRGTAPGPRRHPAPAPAGPPNRGGEVEAVPPG